MRRSKLTTKQRFYRFKIDQSVQLNLLSLTNREIEVFTMNIYAKVRRMHLCETVSINETARRTSLSRSSIRKWLNRA